MENPNNLEIRLKKIPIYNELVKRCSGTSEYSHVLSLINDIGEYSLKKSKAIIKNMPQFTLHDEEHIFNMLYIASKIIPKETLLKLSIPDLLLIILTIFLHDIGMSPSENLIKAWKGQLENGNDLPDYKEEVEKFKRFRNTFTKEIDQINKLNEEKEYSRAQLLEEQIITEYIRVDHANRARKMIAQDWAEKICFNDVDLTAELAEICFSHNESYTQLLKIETIKLCGQDTFLCIPFVAVILRLSDIIDFDAKRTPRILFSHMAIENPISLQEWHKHLSITAWTISNQKLAYSAQCSHPAIEATVQGFCDQIDEELKNCTFVLSNLNNDYVEDMTIYKIPLPQQVDREKIGPKRSVETGKPLYYYRDTKFTLSKNKVIDLLMGTKLYGKPEIALRELIQNSLDACLLRQKLCEVRGEEYTPKIKISLQTENNTDYLSVVDNGIGMNQHILDKYYTNIGNSYYTSPEFYEVVADIKGDFKPISRFGIGILSCFMVCDSMIVNSRRVIGKYQYDEPVKVTVEGYDSLFIVEDSQREEPGTDTTLKLRQTHPWERMDEIEFKETVKKIIPLPPFPIEIEAEGIKEIYNDSSFDELDLDLKDDYSWQEEENIKIVEIILDSDEIGYKGKASIAYIVDKEGPVSDLTINSKDVSVDGIDYTLDSAIRFGENRIEKNITGLEINEDGDIESNNSYRSIANSKSFLSIHGIDVPCELFSNYMNRNQKAVLHFPLPVRFRLDISGISDLNLNSARTQIIYDELWLKFEKELFKLIFTRLKNCLVKEDWEKLKHICLKRTESKYLSSILNEIM